MSRLPGGRSPESLVRQLADGRPRSLQELSLDRDEADCLLRYSEELGAGLSLENNQLKIEGGLDLLDAEALQDIPHVSRLLLLWTVDSTNRVLLEPEGEVSEHHGFVCMSEQQTAGRGRRGRSWFSPFGCNLYISIGWLFRDHAAMAGLSLAAGVETAKCLNSLVPGEPVRLKWPNDLLAGGAKIGGILTEAVQGPEGILAVCGLGLNVRMTAPGDAVGQKWSDLASAGLSIGRTQLAGRLLQRLLPSFDSYRGVAAYQEAFRALDEFYGKPVRVISPGGNEPEISGRGAGIDEDGALLIESAGKLRRFMHGEVSLRPCPA